MYMSGNVLHNVRGVDVLDLQASGGCRMAVDVCGRRSRQRTFKAVNRTLHAYGNLCVLHA